MVGVRRPSYLFSIAGPRVLAQHRISQERVTERHPERSQRVLHTLLRQRGEGTHKTCYRSTSLNSCLDTDLLWSVSETFLILRPPTVYRKTNCCPSVLYHDSTLGWERINSETAAIWIKGMGGLHHKESMRTFPTVSGGQDFLSHLGQWTSWMQLTHVTLVAISGQAESI